MRLLILIILLIGSLGNIFGQEPKTTVYLLSGVGSDHRLFSKLELDSTFDVVPIHYTVPEENWGMKEYAQDLANQIDTTKPYVLVGVSLGGMLATEMSDFMNPEKIILISSAKTREELPNKVKLQRELGLYKIISGEIAVAGAKVVQPLFEPDRMNEKDIFKSMLNDLDPDFLKRTIEMIVEWDREEFDYDIIHIHGERDHAIPIRNVDYSYRFKKGSHMIILTKSEEMSKLINDILNERPLVNLDQ